ncbi:MAG: D-alanine--D-alanine ligase [Coxiella sp. DG_40]|nr:MAG: D-alanine--D-alanine ligase [Coxiella sp. DG_40]
MKIALTYDLKEDYLALGFSSEQAAEFDKQETIDAIADAITCLGHQVERIGNLRQLIAALSQNRSWDLVFNIAESMYGFGREATIPCILEAFKIPYTFSDPLVLAIGLHKGMTKRLARDLGVPTAEFEVVNSCDELRNISLPYPVFVKPVAEGTSKGIGDKSIVHSDAELLSSCSEILEKFSQPVLVESYLSGREFTVGMIGTRNEAKVLGIMEVRFKNRSPDSIYGSKTKENYLSKVEYTLLKEERLFAKISKISLDVWRGLGCRDAGRVDIKLNAQGDPMFMEINPLAGLHPVDSDLVILCGLLNISYHQLIKMILDSAKQRVML